MAAMKPEAARLDLARWAPLVILAASVGALGLAYVAEGVYGIEPCQLCLWQRVPYAVAGLLAVAVGEVRDGLLVLGHRPSEDGRVSVRRAGRNGRTGTIARHVVGGDG